MASKLTAAKSALAGAVLAAASPAYAQDPAKPMPPSAEQVAADAKKVADKVAALEARLLAAEDKVAAQAKEITALKDVVNGTKTAEGITILGLTVKFDDLSRKFTDLQTKYAALEKADSTRTAMSPPTPAPQPMASAPPAVTGPKSTIKIVNDYAGPVKLVLNGYRYEVAPGQTVTVDIQAGEYTYELLGAGPVEKKTIPAGETYNLKIK